MPKRRKKPTRKKLRVYFRPRLRADKCEYQYSKGQDHHKAKLTDHEVDLVLELRSEGWLLREIADKMETPITTISDICKGLTRYRYG